ncbi:hypothetical protein BH23PLA1_BH23PLA1_39550 [soil metagenome]
MASRQHTHRRHSLWSLSIVLLGGLVGSGSASACTVGAAPSVPSACCPTRPVSSDCMCCDLPSPQAQAPSHHPQSRAVIHLVPEANPPTEVAGGRGDRLAFRPAFACGCRLNAPAAPTRSPSQRGGEMPRWEAAAPRSVAQAWANRRPPAAWSSHGSGDGVAPSGIPLYLLIERLLL